MSTRKNASGNYQALRRALLRRGTNLRRWARAHGYNEQSVYHAAKGNRNGVIAYRIRKHLLNYLNHA